MILITKGPNGEVGKIGDQEWKGENRLKQDRSTKRRITFPFSKDSFLKSINHTSPLTMQISTETVEKPFSIVNA